MRTAPTRTAKTRTAGTLTFRLAAVVLPGAGILSAVAAPLAADSAAAAVPAVASPARPAVATTAAGELRTRVVASFARLSHRTPKGREALSHPDDIANLGGHLFVGFQNGVGPQGEASTTGNRRSTVVEFGLRGRVLGQWDVVGKCDGVAADPVTGRVIATVNEDAHSSLYVIDPRRPSRPVHYRYARPLASRGGTDAVSVVGGTIFVTGSAPGTTGTAAPQRAYPAIYRAVLDVRHHVATLHPLFSDEALVRGANPGDAGRTRRLALTDPDSNQVVPSYAPRFAGDLLLTAQGDREQIYVHDPATHRQRLSALSLSAAVDDTAWASGRQGSLYVTDSKRGALLRITGAFHRGEEIVAVTPCSANGAPATCPAPGYPGDYLGRLDPATGHITRLPVKAGVGSPAGLVFLP